MKFTVKFSSDLSNNEGAVVIAKGAIVEFTLESINGKHYGKASIDGKMQKIPMSILGKKCQFKTSEKQVLIDEGILAAPEAANSETTKQEAPKEEKEAPKEKATETKKVAVLGSGDISFAKALVNLNKICNGKILSICVGTISEEAIIGDITFVSPHMPAVAFTINAEDMDNAKFEEAIAKSISESFITDVVNKTEVLAELEKKIDERTKYLEELQKKSTAKPAEKAEKKDSKSTMTKGKGKVKEEEKEEAAEGLFGEELDEDTPNGEGAEDPEDEFTDDSTVDSEEGFDSEKFEE